jgi:predicted small lipoprotein YifL
MHRVAVLLLALVALSGCGNKGALYLPSPERDSQQQNSKPAPRQ